jgi:hypothetical protein
MKTSKAMNTQPQAVNVAELKSAAQQEAEREKRRQGLRMLKGLNVRREGGPVDGLAFQEEQRAAW